MAKANGRILVIDDDRAILELVEQTLSPQYTVVCIEDWLEGIQMLSNSAFDLLILDLAMPVFSPEEFLKRFHTLPSRARIPVLIISAHPSLRERLASQSVSAILPKPFAIADLLTTVERLLNPQAQS